MKTTHTLHDLALKLMERNIHFTFHSGTDAHDDDYIQVGPMRIECKRSGEFITFPFLVNLKEEDRKKSFKNIDGTDYIEVVRIANSEKK